jgi:hypothetical protein
MSFKPDKTEIMIFSNRSIPENLDFSFNGKSVPITTSHKHLGVTFTYMPTLERLKAVGGLGGGESYPPHPKNSEGRKMVHSAAFWI